MSAISFNGSNDNDAELVLTISFHCCDYCLEQTHPTHTHTQLDTHSG